MQKILVRTDKNDTKYFHCVDRCFKCGGTGIIKDHSEYKGTKQTVLTRCKIEEV